MKIKPIKPLRITVKTERCDDKGNPTPDGKFIRRERRTILFDRLTSKSKSDKE